MLFTKEITRITYQDVIDFCNQQIPESINLDYKKDFPKDLKKIISALANSTGGLIIIGVEDRDSKPKLPVKGLHYQKGLREKVNSIILTNIYPPIFPEIQVCEPLGNKTFVVIRVPQSNTTPHYIRHRTQIYIRTDDITHPERLAPAEKIEWLRDGRRKSEELRELLYTNASDRYSNHLKLKKLSGIPFSEATISIAPLYPTEPYKSPQEIKQISEEITAQGYSGDLFLRFPYDSQTKPIQGGVAGFFGNKRNNFIFYTEINQFGLIYHKEDLGRLGRKTINEDKQDEKNVEEIKRTYLIAILRLLDLFLEASGNFYEKLGYWGLVEFKFSLDKLLGVKLIGNGGRFMFEDPPISIDEGLKWQREYYVNEIKNKRVELLIDLIKDIGWSLGWQYITEDKIKSILKEYNRLSEEKD